MSKLEKKQVEQKFISAIKSADRAVLISMTEDGTGGASIDIHVDNAFPYEAIGLLHHAIRVIEKGEE